MAQFSDCRHVYLDETGFDTYLFRPYARSAKGQAVKAKISGKKYQRLSLVAAQIGKKLIAPPVYRQTMASAFFEAWFEQHLLPALTQKSVIILDNARFHRMRILQEMAARFGHHLLPLSPYSPELNPIERTWANIKQCLRSILSGDRTPEEKLASHSYLN